MATETVKETGAVEDPDLSMLKDYVEEYIDATPEARALSEKSRDYKDGYQYTPEEIRKLQQRNQAPIVNNQVKLKVRFLMGMETQNRVDPIALARRPDAEKSGEVSTDALRFVEEKNSSDQLFSDGFDNYLVEGVQGHEVIAEKVNGKMEVKHNQMPWDRLMWDPHSRRNDFSDARWKGTLQWMDTEEAKEQFPDAPETFFSFTENDLSNMDDTFEDKPSYYRDKERDRIRVFYIYYQTREGWQYAVFSGGNFAVKPTESPYLDEDGNPDCQFEFQSAFCDREGNRYGEVAAYLDIQDEINHRHSKGLHLLSVRQTWSKKGVIEDTNAYKQEMSKADGHVEFNRGEYGKDFGTFDTSDMAQAQLVFLQDAKANFETVGANAVMEGRAGTSLSGRAVQSFQQSGVVELGSLFDGHKYLRLRVYRKMFLRIKQFWAEERWVRVLGDANKLKFTGINRPVTLRQKIEEEAQEQGVDASGILERFEGDPRLDEVVEVQNPANELDVDIIMDQTADTMSLQYEQFELLTKMYQANPQKVPFELVIKASQLRNKDELLKLLEGGSPEEKLAQQQAAQQEQEEQAQLMKAAAAAKIAVDESNAEKNQASTVKMQEETKQIAVETAIEVHEAAEPQSTIQ
ncbi:MAG: hypothetical protein GY800_09000 [Planctomycetes bacterium]|nr:hypothetical protein [Planctomycetota bacterium]